jgi:FKBP-type peptidyl-prolyl cis-trans isomerase 2
VPLQFTVGSGQVVAGFDAAINWMKIWETKRVTIEPKDAYGEYDNNKIASVDKAIFEDAKIAPTTWQVYQMWGQIIKVLQVWTKAIQVDANHPMAGKTLIFDITLKAVK